MKIIALGGCCKKSQANYEAICEEVKELGLETEVIHLTDMNEIINLGVLSTPGLVIDGEVVSSGRMLNVKQAKEIISNKIKENR